jgi:2-polyprenyl-3-methyl-5-hydroxy-6-metoxy-1,4-benzoquinol methylase
MLLKFARKIKGFVLYRLMPPHNMFTHPAEKYYYQQYNHYISGYFERGKSLLDVGCQMGRFTIPAAIAGMHVTATDIRTTYFKYISKHLNRRGNVDFRHETLEKSLSELENKKFDVVMCLELLYNLSEPENNFKALSRLVKPDGVIITSHRTPGYYLYRFIREKKYTEAGMVLSKNHPYYNAQTPAELSSWCSDSGLELISLVPVGVFSGFGSDAFTGIANPGKLNSEQAKQLNELETNAELQKLFINNARYMLLIARKKS